MLLYPLFFTTDKNRDYYRNMPYIFRKIVISTVHICWFHIIAQIEKLNKDLWKMVYKIDKNINFQVIVSWLWRFLQRHINIYILL